MYTQKTQSRGGSHARFGSGPSRGGLKRNPFKKSAARAQGNRRPSGGGGRRFKKDYIDESIFINKATRKEVEVYTPTHTFSDFGFVTSLMKNVAEKGYVHPSPIQDQSIPLLMKGHDVIGIANTGTGKTAAFLLPLINKLVENGKHKILILAPTRELAQQIDVEFKAFTRGMKMWSVACVGGAPINKQIRELDLGVHVVIGTPGRVKDLIVRGKIKPELFGSVVLDEADRMLDMGFVDDMRFILGKTPKDRQSLFFSATFSPAIKLLCNDFLREPVTVSVKTRDTSSAIDQDVVRVKDHSKKVEMLHEILINPECVKVLIFREMKRHVDDLGKELTSRGFKALALHGDMRNRERERAVKALATGSVQVVIATDVAARGIDIPDITHVINYDVPSTYDTYIHRIGRTGRGNRKGTALTFI